MIQSTIHLNINATTKQGTLVSTTDYDALGIDVTTMGAKIVGTVVGPDGIAIVTGTVGSPLINLQSGATVSAPFNLPLDSNGNILNGEYTFPLSLRLAASVDTLSISEPNSMIIDTNLYLSNFLVAADVLNMQVSDTDVSVVSATLNNAGDEVTILVVDGLVDTDTSFTFDLTHSTISGSHIWNGCNIITPQVGVTYDSYNTQYGVISFSDTTVLPSTHVLSSRSWSIEYPSNLSPAPVTNPVTAATPTVSFTQSARGPWGYNLTQNVVVTQADGLTYTYTISTGSLNQDVLWLQSDCAVMDCFYKLLQQQVQDVAANGQSALTTTVLLLTEYYAAAQAKQGCGDQVAYAEIIQKMQDLIDNSGACTCNHEGQQGNVWINNAGFDAQTQFEALYNQVNNPSVYEKVLFYSPIPFSGAADYYQPEPDYVRPFSDISAITIDKKYFEADPNGYSKKFVEIEFSSYSRDNVQANITVVDGDTIYTGSNASPFVEVTTRHKVVLTTFKPSGVALTAVHAQSFFIDNDDNASNWVPYAQSFDNVYWPLDADLVLDFTPLLNPTQITYLDFKIKAFATT